jgi:hypothetical protein
MKKNSDNTASYVKAYVKALLRHSMSPLWITDPVKARRCRPKILGPESEKERAINDGMIAKWRERKAQKQR